MNKRIAAALAALGLAATLAACAPGYVEGELVAKDYEPPYTTYIQAGKVPVLTNHPECWELTIEASGGKRHDRCVTAAYWHEVAVGDLVSDGEKK